MSDERESSSTLDDKYIPTDTSDGIALDWDGNYATQDPGSPLRDQQALPLCFFGRIELRGKEGVASIS